jgi:uncharacterized HAD superfamily protein
MDENHKILRAIWHSQDQFNTLVHGKSLDQMTLEERQAWSAKYGMLMLREVSDFLGELNTKPHRLEKKTIINSNVREEWIDIFKYWLCMGRLWGFTPEEFIEEYFRKSEVVSQRFYQERQLKYPDGKVIGVDIDGVLADYPKSFVQFINKELGTDYPTENLKDYNIAESLGLPMEQVMMLKHRYRETGEKRYIPVIDGAKEMLQTFRDAGFVVVLLTARPYKQYKRMFADTQEWLHRNELMYHSIIWDEEKNTRLLREFGRDKVAFFVEDVAKNANSIAELGPTCFLINRPYNLDAATGANVIRANDPREVAQKVLELSQIKQTEMPAVIGGGRFA